jgi:hypothetical protein
VVLSFFYFAERRMLRAVHKVVSTNESYKAIDMQRGRRSHPSSECNYANDASPVFVVGAATTPVEGARDNEAAVGVEQQFHVTIPTVSVPALARVRKNPVRC